LSAAARSIIKRGGEQQKQRARTGESMRGRCGESGFVAAIPGVPSSKAGSITAFRLQRTKGD